MNPLDYQRQLLKSYEQSNQIAHSKMMELITQNILPYMESKLVGPYTTHTTFYFPEGLTYTNVSASSLHWVPLDRFQID